MSTVTYECDACGNAVCRVHPREAWEAPARGCLYDAEAPVNWRKVRVKNVKKERLCQP